MMNTHSWPTVRAFKAKARQLFYSTTPLSATMTWTFQPQVITWPTGKQSMHGVFLAECEGYRSSKMIVDFDHELGWLLR
jgi:hypothetical protein